MLDLRRETVAEIKAALQKTTGLAPESILIACSHTHSAPAPLRLRWCGEADPLFVDRLVRKTVSAATQAWKERQEARLSWACGTDESRWGFNRRGEESIDPTLAALRVEGAGPIATVVNYACHPVILGAENRLISAEWCGYLATDLEQDGGVALFINGATGDVNPTCSLGGAEKAEQMGRDLAAQVRRLLAQASPLSGGLSAQAWELDLPLLPPNREEAEAALARPEPEAPAAKRSHNAMREWAEALLAGDTPATQAATVQRLSIGGLPLYALPGEIFSRFSLQLREAGPAMVAGFANGTVGYVPVREAYPRGGYEVDSAYRYYGWQSALAPEAGEMMVQRLRG